jgi:hypothetical protein
MLVFVIVLLTALGVSIQPSNEKDLRKDLANPVSYNQILTSDFTMHQNTDPFNRSQEIWNLQGKFYSLLDEYVIVHYTTMPLIFQPMDDENRNQFKTGNFEYRGYITSKKQGDWVFAVGPDIRMFNSGGLAVVVIYQPSIFTVGGEGVQIWGEDINQTEVKPIVSLRLGRKTTIGMLDTITVKWLEEKENRWTIPVGLEVGQLFRAQDHLPVNVSFGAFSNVVRPDNASDWYWRLKVDLGISM